MLITLVFGLSLSAKVMAQVPNYVPTNGLVGYWPFDGNTNDLSIYNNHLTNVNNSVYSPNRFGINNTSISLNGINQYLRTSNVANFPVSNQNRTVSFWYNANTTFNSPNLFEFWNPVNLNCNETFTLYLMDPNSGYYFWGRCNDKSFQYGGNYIQEWINLTLVYKNDSLFLFKNGIQLNDPFDSYYSFTNNPINTSITEFLIGTGANAVNDNNNLYNGKIDDFGIWNRALTQEEISALYNTCSGNEITTQPNNSINTIGTNAQFTVNAAAGSTYQ